MTNKELQARYLQNGGKITQCKTVYNYTNRKQKTPGTMMSSASIGRVQNSMWGRR